MRRANSADASVPSSSTTRMRISLDSSSSPLDESPPIIVPKKIAARIGKANVKNRPAQSRESSRRSLPTSARIGRISLEGSFR